MRIVDHGSSCALTTVVTVLPPPPPSFFRAHWLCGECRADVHLTLEARDLIEALIIYALSSCPCCESTSKHAPN